MLEEMLTGQLNGVAGAHSQLFCFYFVQQVCVQSVVSSSQPQQDDLVSSAQPVVALRFVMSCVFLVPFLLHEGFDDSLLILACHLYV